MLVFYTSKITNRIKYIFDFIFSELIITDYVLYDDFATFQATDGFHVVYDKNSPEDKYPLIYMKDIIISGDIIEVPVKSGICGGHPVIFIHKSSKSVMPFDPFAAAFFMVSRYEEYLMHKRDTHKRYLYTNSIAYHNNFLNVPIVHIWVDILSEKLKELFPEIVFKKPAYRFMPTVDVDLAYEHINKGFVRTVGGAFKSSFLGDFHAVKDKILTMWHLRKDPFDTFDYILKLNETYDTDMIFFFLLASRGEFNKGNYEYNRNYRNLIRHVRDYADVGIHFSYNSMEDENLMKYEKSLMEGILHSTVTRSRQHYLRFEIPLTYQCLSDTEIMEDYSMAYASITGFRAGVCVPFKFYDLEENVVSKLEVFPVSLMDATLVDYMKLGNTAAVEEIKRIAGVVKKYNGCFIPLWHNSSLSGQGIWNGRENLLEMVFEYGKADK